jgi:SAM-dependent methyltransferase
MQDNPFFLPGTDQQMKSLFEVLKLNKGSILILGSGSEIITGELSEYYDSKSVLIVEESESLLNSRSHPAAENKINVRLMDFSATDFKDSQFDLVYAQASISNNARNKIVKEIKRILKPDGYFCVGEIIGFAPDQPKFIKDMFSSSNISPLNSDQINDYYSSRGFQVLLEKDLSYTLKDFYSDNSKMLKETESLLDKQEKSFYKKLIKKISHESNIYLKLGGDKYYGFKMLLLRKVQESNLQV